MNKNVENILQRLYNLHSEMVEALRHRTPSSDEPCTSARRKTTSILQFAKEMYPEIHPEQVVALSRFYGEPFPDEEVVRQMVLDGRFYWDVEKPPEPVTSTLAIQGGVGMNRSNLCYLVAAYEVVQLLERRRAGDDQGPSCVHLRLADGFGTREPVFQVSMWVKSFDPTVNIRLHYNDVIFSIPGVMGEVTLAVTWKVQVPVISLDPDKYAIFVSDANTIESTTYVGDRCRSFEVFRYKFRPLSKDPDVLTKYISLFEDGRAMSIFDASQAQQDCNLNLDYKSQAAFRPIRL
jgi:hypothetical protein